MLTRRGIRIALVNFTYGTNSPLKDAIPMVERMERDGVGQMLDYARDNNADFIIALPHWGREYSLRHDTDQQDWAEFLVSRGVCAIVGSHPHVVQDTTHLKGVPVIYSLGNAVSNMSAKNTQMGLMVTLRFVIDHATGQKKMLEPELKTTWCCLPGEVTEGYKTVFIKEWANRKNDWLTLSSYENMMSTYLRVKKATGIED